MTNAYRDENNIPTLVAVLNTNGRTIVRLKANSTTHVLYTVNGVGGSNNGPNHALKDENGVSTLMAISSADGKTPVPLYADLNGNLLVKLS